VKEARDLTHEIKQLGKKLADMSLRLAYKSEGWGGYDENVTRYKDSLIQNALDLLKMIGTSIREEKVFMSFIMYIHVMNRWLI
jgi:hypothetical protein